MEWRYNILDACVRRWSVPSRPGRAIVVYTPGHLGDVLHVVPMMKALRGGLPAEKIVWLVGPWAEALARRYAENANVLLAFGPNLPNFTRGRREWRQSGFRQLRMVSDLRRAGVGTLIAPCDGVGRFLANALCPQLWAGIGDWRPPRVRPAVQTVCQPYEKDRYEADAWCGLLGALGIAARADRLEYAVSPEEHRAAEDFLRKEGVDVSRPLALVAPGSGWCGKNWLPERFGAVAAWLAAERGFQIAWVGGADERSLVPADRGSDHVWMGRTPLTLLAAVLARANLFVGNDGGLLHFAAALEVPTVSIWGPTSPAKWGPRGAIHRQIRKVERCEGCIYWDYRERCRHDHACMKAVRIDDVRPAIDAVLAAR